MGAQPHNLPTKEDWRPRFLAALEQSGNVSEACRLAGVGRSTVYDARRADAAFAADWEGALEASTDALETEARRRAVQGVSRPTQWGKVQQYSDVLLIFLLKAARPEKYRDNWKPRPPQPPPDLDLNADVAAMTDDEREVYRLKLEQYAAKLRAAGIE